MTTTPPTVFSTADLQVRPLQQADVPLLQALFEANPGYFLRVGGLPPRPDEAQQEFDDLPPPHLPWRRQWVLGAFDPAQQLQGLLMVTEGLCADAVWHTGLFLLADALHGTGAAARLHEALQAWAQRGGARWLRLGVVAGNAPAERFWQKCGYGELRTRAITNASGQPQTVRVMVKPLAGGTWADYLALVPRDAPDATLP